MGDVRGRGMEHQGLGLEQPDGQPGGGGQEEAESGSRAGRSRRGSTRILLCLQVLGLGHLMDFQVETVSLELREGLRAGHLGVMGLGHAEPQACVCSPGSS